ncbi:hypothetical protein Hanom_Chr06g00522171 [Helianthus anomalus]
MNRLSHFPQHVFFRNGNEGIIKRIFISLNGYSSETKMNGLSHFPQRVFFRNGNEGIIKRIFISLNGYSFRSENE